MSGKPTLAVPIILCGQYADVAVRVAEGLGPEYDVVHVITSLEAGLDEIPQLLAGEAIRPSSGLGSNAKNASISMTGRAPEPKAVAVGRGFSDEEYEKLRSVKGAKNVPWLKPGHMPEFDAATAKPIPDLIAKRMKQTLTDNGLVPGSDKVPANGVEWVY